MLMNKVLENDGNIAIIRQNYTPLICLSRPEIGVFSDEIGMLVQIHRENFSYFTSKEHFLKEFPVGHEYDA